MSGYNKLENSVEPAPVGVAGVPQEVVVISPTSQQQVSYAEPEKQWGWGTLVMSVISFFCCQIFGMIAIVASMTAYTDHRVKDYAGAQRKRKLAHGFGITAIVLGSLAILTVIILIPVVLYINQQSQHQTEFGSKYVFNGN